MKINSENTPLLVLGAAIIFGLIFGGPDSHKDQSNVTRPMSAPGDMKGSDTDYLGLTIDEAEELAAARKLKSRVVMTDGVAHLVTMDFNESRLNFTICGGKVEKTSRG